MNKQDIINLVSNISGVDPDEIDADSDFFEDLNCEPKDIVELQLQLEDLLKTKIDSDKFMEIQTVGDLFELIEEYDNEFID